MFVNTVPSIEDSELKKGLAYPFQSGPAGFPATSSSFNRTYHKIKALLETNIGERVMMYDLGVNVLSYVFSNMTPIQKVRLANAVSNVIQKYIPGVVVDNVSIVEEDRTDGSGKTVIYDVSYIEAGQSVNQQFSFDPGS